MTGATVAILETEAADVDGRVPPITAVAVPAVKMAAMSMPTPPAGATATASAKIVTRDGSARVATAQAATAQAATAQVATAQEEETAEEAIEARGNGTVTGATGATAVAGAGGTAAMTDGSVAPSAI